MIDIRFIINQTPDNRVNMVNVVKLKCQICSVKQEENHIYKQLKGK